MQNRFGLKDFIFLVLLIAIAVSVWLTMVQRDRLWGRVLTIDDRIGSIERQVARVEEKLDTRPVFVDSASSGGAGSPRVSRDESWARPGVPIEWQAPYTFANDPRSATDYAPGGDFTEIFEAQPSKIVPFLSTDVYGRRVIDRVCEPLATYDPETLELRGVLADAWQADPAGLWLRVRINSRARFSDGTPVTAEDVRWTVEEFIRNPQMETERVRSTIDMFDKVIALDTSVVEFTFKEPLFSNVSSALALYVLPAHFYSRFDAADINSSTGLLVGSGMYRLESVDRDRQWTPGTPIVIVRNEQYWGHRAPLASLRFRTVTDDLARLQSYRKGEGDMILPSSSQLRLVPKDDPQFLDENAVFEWYNMRSGYSFIAWQCGPRNNKLTPFADPRVRRAMTHLLDREVMIRDIWEGVGRVATGPSNSDSFSHNPDLEPWPYDLDTARALLAEAGWRPDSAGIMRNDAGEAFEFQFTRSQGGEAAERLSTYIRDQCARIGIRCRVHIVDWSIISQILKSRDFDALVMSWSPNAPESDPRQVFHSAAITDQGDNFVQWAHPDADRLIEAGRRELVDERRYKIWHELEALIHEEQPYTFLRESPWARFIRRDVGNVHTYRTGLEPWEFFRLPGFTAAQPY